MSEQDKLLDNIRQHLESSVEGLDASSQSRLTQIRHQVLDKTRPPARSWQKPLFASGAIAAAVVLSISLTWNSGSLQPALEDMSLLSANDSLELIDNMEFYQWLSDELQHG